MSSLIKLKKHHIVSKKEIENRLFDFKKLKKAGEERIFEELCFCLLTAGSNAQNCKEIIIDLKNKNLLLKGGRKQLWPFLKRARFYDQKAKRLIAARKLFSQRNSIAIKGKVFKGQPLDIRDWLVENVNGLGYKEASHFLRNIGLGEDLAILDRHVLKRLTEYGVIAEQYKSLTPKRYLEIEKKMREFSYASNIPLAHLDLLFFSVATGKPISECK